MDSAEQKLQQLRDRIDATDEALAQLFISRIGIIREVAVLKAANWPKACHIRPGREGQMHRAITKRYTGTGFPARMALAIWRQLIGGSTHVESPLNISYGVDFPEHYWLGREYFGLQIGATQMANLEEGIAQIKSGKSNILLLPSDTTAPCWPMAKTLVDAGLFIFAALPVEQEKLPNGQRAALALAPLTPEDSGDDISYFLNAQGKVETVDGFTTTHGDAIFLGAHPRPIQFQE